MPSLFRFVSALAIICTSWRMAAAQPAIGGDPRVNADDFQITTFASGLNYPLGMALLADGSIMVVVSNGTAFFSSTSGSLIRLEDNDDDGVAENMTVLANNVPGGGLTAVRTAGELVFVTAQGAEKPITIYRLGATVAAPLTEVGRILINYDGNWHHPNSALMVRSTPGENGSYDLFFQLGSSENFAKTTRTLSLNSTIGVAGTLNGDALYMLQIRDDGVHVTGANLTQIATGLRNAAGMAFHPTTGDLYVQDNGIDGLVNSNEPLSADELNTISANNIGGAIEDFGFPDNYIAYRTGEFIGGGGIRPLIAFLPIPNPQTGAESTGPNDVVFAPRDYPAGLNDGIFVGFHGQFSAGGMDNAENPVVYIDLNTREYFHFIAAKQPNVGHLDGLLATTNSLFLADLSSGGGFSSAFGNQGVIYRIRRKTITTNLDATTTLPPIGFNLSEAWPNPFQTQTAIRYQLQTPAHVVLSVYNLNGQKVATLVDQRQPEGQHIVRWNGMDNPGVRVASGLYLYRIQAGDFVQTKRVLFMKQ